MNPNYKEKKLFNYSSARTFKDCMLNHTEQNEVPCQNSSQEEPLTIQ